MDLPKSSSTQTVGSITDIQKTETHYLIKYGCESAKLNILNDHVFKFHMSPTGEFEEFPKPTHTGDTAKITSKPVADYDLSVYKDSVLTLIDDVYTIETKDIKINFNKKTGKMSVFDKNANKDIFKEKEPLNYKNNKTTQVLHIRPDEYFFGGGMQNGRFNHRNEKIVIENTSDWNHGCVPSPCPFYWSSNGYGVLRNTWQPGVYDFGFTTSDELETVHDSSVFDAFFFISQQPKDILSDYFELTGRPIFMPEYAFYEGHSNTYNRDYWVEVTAETPGAILFEDTKYYKRYTPSELKGKEGVLETLNGEIDNYQFSARGMIDRYKMHNMPLGWFIPNDGPDSSYGQTDSFEGDLNNLKEFQHYAKEDGIEVGLWTESNLVPANPEHPKKGERDFAKEVSQAGVRALKCDVFKISQAYSHGLYYVDNATTIFNNATNNKVRPLIITTRGWAGTQRYSGIWTGNQKGGQWENIQFHIPTFIGASLSGLPAIGSDMDGIFAGGDKEVNVRDFQWKSFTPLQINMDGWGSIRKTPFSFDYEATSINRAYLKTKSMLMPYNYTIGYESTYGLPMVRAMFLEFPKEVSAYMKESQYQYMWGPNILVAPVYEQEKGSQIRSGIYLPDSNQIWIDAWTGEKYQGGRMYNSFKAPLWKMPLFVKDGAILPVTRSHNNPNEIKRHERVFLMYPNGASEFEVYEDDGFSLDYTKGQFGKTKVTAIGPETNKEGDLKIHINKLQGNYNNMIRERSTMLKIQASQDVECITITVNDKTYQIKKVNSIKELKTKEDVYYFTKEHVINKYLIGVAGNELKQGFLLVKLRKTDVLNEEIRININGFANKGEINGLRKLDKYLHAPYLFTVPDKMVTTTSLTLQWQPIDKAEYEIERDGLIFTNISGHQHTFDGFIPGTRHSFKIRTVTETHMSKWSYIILADTIIDGSTQLLEGDTATSSVREPGNEIEKPTDATSTILADTKKDGPTQVLERDTATSSVPEPGNEIEKPTDASSTILGDTKKDGPTQELEGDTATSHVPEPGNEIEKPTDASSTILADTKKDGPTQVLEGDTATSNVSEPGNEIEKPTDGSSTILADTKKDGSTQVLEGDTATSSVPGPGNEIEKPTDGSSIILAGTKKNGSTRILKGVRAICSIRCEPGYEIEKFTNGDLSDMWHTDWKKGCEASILSRKFIKLLFDLRSVYKVQRVDYYPPENAGNGTFLQIRYRISKDRRNWNEFSGIIYWLKNNCVETIPLNGLEMRYLELHVMESVGGFGSGRLMNFHVIQD